MAAVLGKRSPAVDGLNSALHLKLVKITPDMGKLDNYGFLQQSLTQKSLDDCPAPVSLLYDGFGYFMDVFSRRGDICDLDTKRQDLEMAVDSFAER